MAVFFGGEGREIFSNHYCVRTIIVLRSLTAADTTMMAINVKLALLLVSVTALGLPWFAHGYATGAPKEVCEDMLPQHGAPAQTKESPYTLTTNRKSVKGGETVTLTLAAKDQSKFKGFLVQARNGNGAPIGSFTPLPPSKSGDEFKGKWKLITCPKGPTNVSILVPVFGKDN